MISTATLRLRARHRRITTHIFWPVPGVTRPLLVAFVDPDSAQRLCAEGGQIVLSMPVGISSEDVWRVLQWAAAHASELGARDGCLSVLASGERLDLTGLAEQARVDGWPEVFVVSADNNRGTQEGQTS